ncbi:MAG TPA: hypothetical protein VH251_05860 [Verrucomicrobiae bacterium]|jgi:hypothetical protein|nr:hypothetical protein [Verrucomicrobiae bacterium]
MQHTKAHQGRSSGIAKSPKAPQNASSRDQKQSSMVGRESNRPGFKMEQVRRELRNDDSSAAVDEPNIMAQRLDKRPFSTGHKIENHLPEDDEVTERLVQKGADDAGDNETLEADRTSTKNEG